VVGAVRPQDMGKASGVNATTQRFGSAFAIAVGAAVFAGHGHIGSPASFVAGYQPALIVVACLSLLGALTALGVQTPKRAVSIPVAIEAAEVA
jgi:hypothetical protein